MGKFFSNIQPLNYKELDGKILKMIYLENEEFGLLAGQDTVTLTVYVLGEVNKNRTVYPNESQKL